MITEHSQSAIDLIKEFEGCRLTSYYCAANVITIGFGHTGHDVKEYQTITQEQAEELLNNDLHFVSKFIASLKVNWNQNQFDAIVSFAFNLGGGALKGSTLLKKARINTNDPTIKKEFGKWVYANHKVLPGLIRRREAESNLYFKIS